MGNIPKKDGFNDIVIFEQFKKQLKAHRQQIKKKRDLSSNEMQAFISDRAIHPKADYNHRGEKVFDSSDAKMLLRDDIKHKKQKAMSPMDLWNSREEYKEFKLEKFRQRIYQEERRVRYVNHLEMKRQKKAEEAAKAKQEAIKNREQLKIKHQEAVANMELEGTKKRRWK